MPSGVQTLVYVFYFILCNIYLFFSWFFFFCKTFFFYFKAKRENVWIAPSYTHAQINRNWLWKLISPLSVINPIKILDQIKALENRKRMKPSRKTLVKSFRSSEVSKRATAKWDGENSTSHNPHYRVQLFIFRCVHASL